MIGGWGEKYHRIALALETIYLMVAVNLLLFYHPAHKKIEMEMMNIFWNTIEWGCKGKLSRKSLFQVVEGGFNCINAQGYIIYPFSESFCSTKIYPL